MLLSGFMHVIIRQRFYAKIVPFVPYQTHGCTRTWDLATVIYIVGCKSRDIVTCVWNKVERLRAQDGNIQVRTTNFKGSEKASPKGKQNKKATNTCNDVAGLSIKFRECKVKTVFTWTFGQVPRPQSRLRSWWVGLDAPEPTCAL